MPTNKMSRPRVGVVGGSGYTGREVLQLLSRHGGVDVAFATSRSEAGRATAVDGLAYTESSGSEEGDTDVVFLCLPHGEASAWLTARPDRAARVVDLTADHRPGSGREADAVYGLAELRHDEVVGAGTVANPGCYPTGVLLSLVPALSGGLLDPSRTVVVNAASGVTGAGRSPRRDLLFAEVFGDFRAYQAENRHRHLLEMRAALPGIDLVFTPHLLPVPRGILETIHVPVQPGVGAADLRSLWRGAYAGWPSVRVVDEAPGLADVVHTDRLHLWAGDPADAGRPCVTVVAAFDNLGKGAAGQALQNMNLMLGLAADRGLRC